jgi:DNA-binding response OmpR family regulator
VPRPRLVLLIEPDPTVESAYRSHLERQGYRVLAARDGAAGLALAREHRPSVIVGDFPMPVVGEGLFPVLVRRDEHLSDVFIINVTDRLLTEKDSVSWLLSDRVIAKPIDGERLLEEVSRAVQRKGVLEE